MSYLQRLYDRYKDGNDPFVNVIDDGDNYIFTLTGRFDGQSKVIIFGKDKTKVRGGTRRWVPTENVEEETIIYDEVEPTPPPAPDPGPNLDTITTPYSSFDGYGEVDIEKAIEYVKGNDLASQAPVQDNFGENLYGLDRIGAPESWAGGYTGEGIIIAVIDTGIDRDHAELDDNIWVNTDEIAGDGIDNDGNGYIDDYQGWNFVDENNNVEDSGYHGSHVAGTIAAEVGGSVQGVAYNATIMPLKVFGPDGGATVLDITDAIVYAVDNGAHIINMSLGFRIEEENLDPAAWAPLRTAMKYANDNGVVVVTAAGNDNFTSPAAPGAYAVESGIVVGALDNTGNLDTRYSNLAGPAKDYEGDGALPPLYVSAAGTAVWSTVPDNSFGFLDGTSMAAPHVAAAIALLLEAHPTLTPDQVRVVLANTTK